MSAATEPTSAKAYRETTLRGGGLILTIVAWLAAVAGAVLGFTGTLDGTQAGWFALPMLGWLIAAAAITRKRLQTTT